MANVEGQRSRVQFRRQQHIPVRRIDHVDDKNTKGNGIVPCDEDGAVKAGPPKATHAPDHSHDFAFRVQQPQATTAASSRGDAMVETFFYETRW